MALSAHLSMDKRISRAILLFVALLQLAGKPLIDDLSPPSLDGEIVFNKVAEYAVENGYDLEKYILLDFSFVYIGRYWTALYASKQKSLSLNSNDFCIQLEDKDINSAKKCY